MILTSGQLVVLFLYIWRMNKKWYIIGFVMILTFLGGVVSQQHISQPNQEIVVHFTSSTIDHDEVTEAITEIKNQLEAAGVTNIQVTKLDNGELTIAYHSTAKVSVIKQVLLNAGAISINDETPLQEPSNKSEVAFNFDVYEIKSASNTDINLLGVTNTTSSKGDFKQTLESNSVADRFSNSFDLHLQSVATAYRFYKDYGIVFSCNSYKIPEVRAGPFQLG